MDKYLNNKQNINMFHRLLNFADDIETVENTIELFFDILIPYMEKNISLPYKLFKHFQEIFPNDLLRYVIYEEIILYYIKDHEPYIKFEDKTNLDFFLKFVDKEDLRLSDKIGIGFDRNELLQCALQSIKIKMDSFPTLLEKRNFLLLEKIECVSRMNYELIKEIEQLLDIINEQLRHDVLFVDLIRINELKSKVDTKWDLLKLVQFCEELNSAYENKNYITIPVLLRAIIDHVPPIFEEPNFNEVIAKHGTKSFKDSMSHLDKSCRKIADSIMHSKIRDKEILPNHTQIDFRADLDVLLAEISRILKKQQDAKSYT